MHARRRTTVRCAAAATAACLGLLIPSLAALPASAAGPTAVVTVDPDGHSGTGAAGTCLLYQVVPRDATYEPSVTGAGQGFVTVTLTEVGELAQQDVDFCIRAGRGDAITRAPKYPSGDPTAPTHPSQAYNPGETVTPEEPANPVKARQDVAPAVTNTNPAGRPDIAAVEPPAASTSSPTPTNNVKGTDTATFAYDADAGGFFFGVVGLVPGSARLSAYFDKNGDGEADTAATALDPGGDVHAEDVGTTFSSGGAPFSVSAANAVRTLEATPKTASVVAGSANGAPLTAVARNAEGHPVAGVTPRMAPEVGTHAGSTATWTGSCGPTDSAGHASCSYAASSAGSDTVALWVNQAVSGATAGRDAGEPFDTVSVTVAGASGGAGSSPRPSASATPTATISPSATASPRATASSSASATPTRQCTASSVGLGEVLDATREAAVTVRASADRPVRLLAYSRPSTTYRVVREGLTGPDGTVTFTVRPLTNTRLFAEEPGCPASPTQVLQVRSALTLGAARAGVRTVDFRGRVIPARPGQLVSLYRVEGNGRQVLTGQTRVDGRGVWTLRRVFSGTGRFGFVARTGSDIVNLGGTSPVRTVDVR